MQKKCKQNLVFIVYCSREISPRNFVKALANFLQTKFRRHLGEISHPLKRNFVGAKIRTRKILLASLHLMAVLVGRAEY